MGKVATEATLSTGVEILKAIAKGQLQQYKSWEEIQQIVQSGLASSFFEIGDQLSVNWNDGTNAYVLPFDVVKFENVELENGNSVPGMFIQSHYALQAVQFDNCEAFYEAPSGGLAAGTYHFTTAQTWGNITTNETLQFTLTTDLAEGGMLCIEGGWNTLAKSSWKVKSYASATATSATEEVALTVGSDGTDLGTISNATKYGASGLNNMQRIANGYNRWSKSALRQYLNSDSAAGSWWSKTGTFDHAPTQLTTVRGFMAGLDSAFVNVIKPVKVTTALNTVTDSDIGTTETTYDRFFSASLQEEFINPQLSGEGTYYPYWKERVAHASPTAQYATEAKRIRYAYDNHSSAVGCRLRSAYRGNAYSTWNVYSSGAVDNYGGVTNAIRPAPACVIC